jgi:hypothetical protein
MKAAGRTVSSVAAALGAFALAAFVSLPSAVFAQDSTSAAASSTGDDSGQVLELPRVYTPQDQSCASPQISSSNDPNCPPAQASSDDVEQYANQGQPAAGDINAYMNQQSMAEGGGMASPYGLAAAPMAIMPFYPLYQFVSPPPTVVSPPPARPAPRPRPHFGPRRGGPFGPGVGHGMPHFRFPHH